MSIPNQFSVVTRNKGELLNAAKIFLWIKSEFY